MSQIEVARRHPAPSASSSSVDRQKAAAPCPPAEDVREPDPRAFTQDEKLADLRDEWPRFTDSELLLLPSELNRDEESALNRVENVERMAIDFWTPMLDRLR